MLSKEQLLAMLPWPAAQSAENAMEWFWSFELPATPDKLWPHVIDTSRLNRALGLAPMEFEEREGVLCGRSKNGGVLHEWTEPPWDWVANHHLTVARHYSRGFATYVLCHYYLEAIPSGTRMYVYFGWIPRGVLGRLALKVGMGAIETKYGQTLQKIADEADSATPTPFQMPAPALAPEGSARIQALRQSLIEERSVDATVAERMCDLIRNGDDLEVDRVQPRRLARDWAVAEHSVLSGFLHATRVGLFDLSWDVICPLCRGTRLEVDKLSSVPSDGSCQVCELEFATSTEHAVEVSFRPHPAIREIPKLAYCSAEPSTKLHILTQLMVPPGGERRAETRLGPGRYRIRIRGGGEAYIDVGSEPAGDDIDVGKDLSDIECGQSPSFVFKNVGETSAQFIIEGVDWSDDALLPEHLLSFQDFRDLFSDEYVARDIQLSVGKQTILFTDIVGSTRFYAEHGDPTAFVRVRDHFEHVFGIVAANNGAVVKTIGDAVMATFASSVDSLKASRAIHDVFPPDGEQPIKLRISLNAGPCIAVNLNSGMDYFGGTVNVAAKLQACAEAGETALGESVWQAPGVQDFLKKREARIETLEFESVSLDEKLQVYRWR